LADKAAQKRLLASVSSAKSIRVSLGKSQAVRAAEREQREKELREKQKQGLVGHRFGKHKIKDSEVDVQLGEELSESLRGLKVCVILMVHILPLGLTHSFAA
jgi:nucleolar protein 53